MNRLNSKASEGCKVSWARARIIAKIAGTSTVVARSNYAEFDEAVRNNSTLWRDIASGKPPAIVRLQQLLAMLDTNQPQAAQKLLANAKPQAASNGAVSHIPNDRLIPQEPIVAKGEDPETLFRRLVFDLGAIRSRQIMEQVSEAVLAK